MMIMKQLLLLLFKLRVRLSLVLYILLHIFDQINEQKINENIIGFQIIIKYIIHNMNHMNRSMREIF